MPRARTIRRALIAVASCCVVLGVALPPAAATSPPDAISGGWTLVEHPSPPGQEDLPLRGLWMSGQEVWAVGHAYADLYWRPWGVRCVGGSCTPLEISGPDDSVVATAMAIDGTSTEDVWVVGRQLVKHFDGLSWDAVDTSSIGVVSWSDVDAVSPTDVWAVGTVETNGLPHTIAAHWDGIGWLADSADLPTTCGPGDDPQIVAAGGGIHVSTTCDGRGTVLVRDQLEWRVELDTAARIHGLDLVAGKLWATGSTQLIKPRVWREGHGAWRLSKAPSIAAGALTAMAGTSNKDRWAVGATPIEPTPSWFVAHWNGDVWTLAAQPEDTVTPLLYDVQLDADGSPWAVGGETDGCPYPTCGDRPVLLRGLRLLPDP